MALSDKEREINDAAGGEYTATTITITTTTATTTTTAATTAIITRTTAAANVAATTSSQQQLRHKHQIRHFFLKTISLSLFLWWWLEPGEKLGQCCFCTICTIWCVPKSRKRVRLGRKINREMATEEIKGGRAFPGFRRRGEKMPKNANIAIIDDAFYHINIFVVATATML